MTSTEALRLDNSNPEFERVQPFQEIQKTAANEALVFQYEVSSDATDGLTCLTAPCNMVVTDIQWVTTVGVESGSVTIQNGANAVCAALAATTANALSRMATDVALEHLVLDEGDTLTIVASKAATTGVLTIMGIKA